MRRKGTPRKAEVVIKENKGLKVEYLACKRYRSEAPEYREDSNSKTDPIFSSKNNVNIKDFCLGNLIKEDTKKIKLDGNSVILPQNSRNISFSSAKHNRSSKISDYYVDS